MKEEAGEDELYWGVCPKCRKNDGFLNVGRAHYFVCHKHKVRWLRGENLFSIWREETQEDWNRNIKLLETYEEIEPQFE